MYKVEVNGRGGMSARVIAHSITEWDKTIGSLELEFPRFILAQMNTHSALSKNAASSRAIRILKQIEQINDNPAMPLFYGKEQKGMSALEELSEGDIAKCKAIILDMRDYASEKVTELSKLGLHKQTANRYIEPWQMVKGVITATEWKNFLALRNHGDAQPEITELAQLIEQALEASEPELLGVGEWHTPYVNHVRDSAGVLHYSLGEEEDFDKVMAKDLISIEDALKVSAGCCAQVSYRTLNTTLKVALSIYDKLVNSKPVHASPFEHPATPIDQGDMAKAFKFITHVNPYGNWSANFNGWTQYRQLIKDNVVRG